MNVPTETASDADQARAERIRKEIHERAGDMPGFFESALTLPDVLDPLWAQTKGAYLDNALPAAFKDKLGLLLAGYCHHEYCAYRFTAQLLGYGLIAGDPDTKPVAEAEVHELIASWRPSPHEISNRLDTIAGDLSELPWRDRLAQNEFETAVLICCAPLFLRGQMQRELFEPNDLFERCQAALQQTLGGADFQRLMLLVSFFRSMHFGVESQANIEIESTVRQFMESHASICRSIQLAFGGGAQDDAGFPARSTDIDLADDGRLRLIADSLPVSVVYFDREERVQYFNSTCKRLWEEGFGLVGPDAIGRHARDVIGEANYAKASDLLQLVLAGETVEFDLDIQVRNGDVRHRHVTCLPHLSSKGEFLGYYTLTSDVTDRVRTDRESRTVREAMQTVVEGTSRVTGQDYFDALVEHLADALGFKHVMIAKTEGESNSHARTLAYWSDGQLADEVYYELEGTPCNDVLNHMICCYPNNVQASFPADVALVEMGVESYIGTALVSSSGDKIGLLSALDDRPMDDRPETRAMLKLFADRAAAELDRIHAEAARQEEEHRFRSLFESCPDGVAFGSPDGRIVEMNPAFLDMLGYTPDELRSMHYSEITPEKYLKQESHNITQVLDSGIPIFFEKEFIRKDGSLVPVGLTGWLMKDRQGAIQYLAVFVKDISQNRQAEADLIQSRQRLQLALDAGEIGTWDWDIRNNLLRADERFARIFGVDPKAIAVGVRPAELIEVVHVDDAAPLSQIIANDYLTAESISQEFRIHKDGEIRWVVARGRIECDENGEPIRCPGALSDITDRKLSEESRRKHEQLLEATHRVADVGGWELDLLTMNLFWTAQTYRIHEVPLDYTPIVDTAIDFYAPEARDIIRAAVDEGIQHGKPWDLELPFETAMGRRIWVRAQGEVECVDGKPVRLYGAFQDITKRKKVEQRLQASEEHLRELNIALEKRVAERTDELQKANDDLEAYARSVTHDLRAPVRAMEGFAAALSEDFGDRLDENGRDYIQRIVRSAQRMDLLIEDLLAYSRLGRSDLKLRSVLLDRVIREALEELSTEIDDCAAQIDVDESMPNVLGHPGTITQIISNLVANGIKFVAPGTKPHIRIWSEPKSGNMIRLWIEDNGVGIDPKHYDRIFQPFERLHGIESYPGTGIGLAIVARACDRLGGRYGVESEIDSGSRFWLELRLADEDPAA